jgi:hypothetical protein
MLRTQRDVTGSRLDQFVANGPDEPCDCKVNHCIWLNVSPEQQAGSMIPSDL